MSEPVWLPVDLMIQIHERQIAEHGGGAGTLDISRLESAMARPMNAYGYGERDICALASLYAHGICKAHAFVDGNKRTAYIACELFIEANGLVLTAPDEECIAYMLGLTASEIDADEFAEWLRSRVQPS